MTAKKENIKNTWVDPDDAPELTDTWFETADLYKEGKLVRRGRPKLENPKVATSIRYDANIIEAFKATGKGWQGRMNDALAEWLKTHKPAQ